MNEQKELSILDRFEIFEQINLHQRLIDTPWGRKSVNHYNELYWPEGQFVVNDLRHAVFSGPDGLKQMFDYAHSVFPLEKWFHTMGPFRIDGGGSTATAHWRWIVNWRQDGTGVVSTGTYADKFEKRGGIWKCLERVSETDPNWPADLFQPWIDQEKTTFKAS